MKTAIILITAALLCGCASVGNQFDSRKVAEIKKGETTEADLVKMFGKPVNRGINSETGPTLTWVYSQAVVKGTTFIPIVGAFAGGADSKTKSLVVSLDENGRVASYQYNGGDLDSTSWVQSDPEKPTQTTTTQKSGSPKMQ